MAENIFDQLSELRSLLEIKLFSADNVPYKENDCKKYYKLTCSITFKVYYKYVAVNDDCELRAEIERFGDEISEGDLRRIESVEVTVKDCLQDFIDSYEKKIQKWYFLSNWDASQGRTPKMDEMFEEVRNSPVFHTYSALRKWERFENYREELLKLCERTDTSIGEYRAYLKRLESASVVDAEYLDIRGELEIKLENKLSGIRSKFPIAKRKLIAKNTVANSAYEINEDKLKFLFWEVEYNGDGCNHFIEMPTEIACILTDTKLNVMERWQYTENKNTPQELKTKLDEVLKENYLIIFGWPADFMSLKHFLSPDTYMTCDLGTLYARIVGKYIPLDRMSEVILGDEDFSMTDAERILAVFKELCNLRGESPCDMIRFFQMSLKGK